MENKRVVKAIGYYGFGNLGDETIANILSERGIIPIKVSDSRNHFKRFVNILTKELMETDAFIIGGGGLFQSYTNACKFYASLSTLLSLKRPVFWFGVSIENISKVDSIILKIAAKKTKFIMVRDSFSKKFLPVDAQVGTDIVFLKNWEVNPIAEKINILYIARDKILDKQLDSFKNVKKIVIAKDDVCKNYELILDFQKLIDLCASSNIVITERYHGMLAAVIAKKPFLVTGNRLEKAKAFCFDNSIGYPFIMDVKELKHGLDIFSQVDFNYILEKNYYLAQYSWIKLQEKMQEEKIWL